MWATAEVIKSSWSFVFRTSGHLSLIEFEARTSISMPYMLVSWEFNVKVGEFDSKMNYDISTAISDITEYLENSNQQYHQEELSHSPHRGELAFPPQFE